MEFHTAYHNQIQHTREINKNIRISGLYAFENTNKKSEKEEILLRLLFLFPKDGDLYYKMASLFEGDLRSLAWHKMCFTINPRHKENIIMAIQTLYSQGLLVRVFDYIDTPIFTDLIEDPRFLSIYSRCNFQQLYYKNGVTYLLKLIRHSCNIPSKTYEEKVDKWSNYHDLGYVYCIMGEIESALKYTKKAVELADKFRLDMWRRLLSFSNLLCYEDFHYSDKAEIFKTYLKINDYFPDKPIFSHDSRKSGRKIRIGYVSSDYMYHSCANFSIPIFENHDRSRFEIILYANQTEFSTDIFVNLDLPYRMIKDKDDETVARMIYNDRIDILIDLNGHTIGNRLDVFRFHPAPVQITYLGYPNTTGLKAIQYRITDGIADAEDSLQPYSEKLIRLPTCFLLYKPFNDMSPVKPRELSDRTIILGSMNKENKMSQETLNTWSDILRECPNTKILIKLDTFDNIEERKTFYIERLKTCENRILIVPKQHNAEYYQLFSHIDILLDPFPYSGTTTTCNALFNSIPVVTLYHKGYHAHNVSASILKHSGLSELVAYSFDEYISIVKELVENREKISEYKRTIHRKFRDGMMDGARFMKGYETALMNILNGIQN